MRPSTEWVDTVEVGANVLVDDDPDADRGGARRRARCPPSGPPLYGDGHASERIAAVLGASGVDERRRSPPPDRPRPCPAVRCAAVHRDVAIIGAGYVGVPLAQVFADAGRSVAARRRQPRARRAAEPRRELHRGRPEREAEAARRRARPARDDRLRRAPRGRRDPDRAADAALEAARARPLDRAGGDRADRDAAPQGPPRRARVDDLPGHDARRGAADPRGRLRAHAPASTSISRSRPSASTRAASTTRRRPCRRSSAASTRRRPRPPPRSTAAPSTRIHRVSSPEAAELTKLLENIFRSVNIALVNELAQLCDRMGIDIWEVVDAAATKPFGFMRFEPGPGLGGHCIPIDPFYLTWKAREFDFSTRFIELAGEVNQNMPYYCRSRVSQALNHGSGKSLKGSRILVLGVAYKADISDMRESPAVKLIELLQNAGADVSYHDPHVPSFSEHGTELTSQPLDPAAYDAVVIATAHSSIDYAQLVDRREPRRRPAQRARPRRASATRRSGSCDPGRPRRRRRLGQERRPRRRRADRARLGRATPTRTARREYAARYPQATRDRARSPTLLADDDGRRGRRSRRPVPTHYALAKQALEAGKHVFVEKPPAMRGEEMAELVELARANDRVLMPGPPPPLPPRPAQGEGARRRGRARRRRLRLRQPPEPRRDPLERERALVARRPRPLGDPVAARRGAGRGRRATGGTSCSRGSRTSSSASSASPPARSRTCTSRGSTRTRCGR